MMSERQHLMTTTSDCVPGRAHPCWLIVDYETLLANIAACCHAARYIDLSLPLLQKIWSLIEDDLLRAGISGALCNTPRPLLEISSSMQRILRPGYRPSETGYVREGLLPVISSFSECLSLSNMAQTYDQRLNFLLRVRSRAGEYGSGDWGLDTILEQLANVPMIDMHGFFMQRQPGVNETSSLKRHLRKLEATGSLILLPLASSLSDQEGLTPFIEWETVSLDEKRSGTFPVEIGFWAFPVHTGRDHQIFQTDIGSLDGLPTGDFPAQICGKKAGIVEMHPDRCEFVVEELLHGPFPVKGFLTGGSLHEPLDLRQWKLADLRSLLAHLSRFPIFVRKNGRCIELPA